MAAEKLECNNDEPLKNGTMKKKDEHHIKEGKTQNTDQYHVKKISRQEIPHSVGGVCG